MKNIIIMILVLLNGFLLGSLAMRQTAAVRSRHRTEAQLVSLFAADGMTLEEGVISRETPPPSLSLSRNPEREREAAEFFLGPGLVRSSLEDGTCLYSSESGVAQFRSNGAFDIVGSLPSQDGVELCRKFCKRFSCEEPVFSLDSQRSGTGTAVCLYGKRPVYNSTVLFTLDQGKLLTVSGTLLPGEGAAVSEEREPLSAAAALTSFQQMRRESYAVVSAVTDMYLCYELQGSTASALSLAPAWCIVTDASKYYVNCVTGVAAAD